MHTPVTEDICQPNKLEVAEVNFGQLRVIRNNLLSYYATRNHWDVDDMLDSNYGVFKVYYSYDQTVKIFTIKKFLENFEQLQHSQLLAYPTNLIAKIDFNLITLPDMHTIDLDSVLSNYVVLDEIPNFQEFDFLSLKILDKYKRGFGYFLIGNICGWVFMCVAVVCFVLFIVFGLSNSASDIASSKILGIAALIGFVNGTICCLVAGALYARCENFLVMNNLTAKCQHDIDNLGDMVYQLMATRMVIKALEQAIMIKRSLTTIPDPVLDEIIIYSMGDVKSSVNNFFSDTEQQLLCNYFNSRRYLLHNHHNNNKDSVKVKLLQPHLG